MGRCTIQCGFGLSIIGFGGHAVGALFRGEKRDLRFSKSVTKIENVFLNFAFQHPKLMVSISSKTLDTEGDTID